MLSMTATVAHIDSETVTLTNVRKYAHYNFPDQIIRRGIWSNRITAADCVIGFNANVKTYQICDTDGETYRKVTRTEIKPTSRAIRFEAELKTFNRDNSMVTLGI